MVTRVDDKEQGNVIPLAAGSLLKRRPQRHSSTARASLLMQPAAPVSDTGRVVPLRKAHSTERSRALSGDEPTGMRWHFNFLTKANKRAAISRLLRIFSLLGNGKWLTERELWKGDVAAKHMEEITGIMHEILPPTLLKEALNISPSALTEFCQRQDLSITGLSPEMLEQALVPYRRVVDLFKAANEAPLESATSTPSSTKS